MNTNFLMLKELDKKYTPEDFGVLSPSESRLIIDTLCLSEMDILQLRNLRDFTVMFYSQKTDSDWSSYKSIEMDKLSAITHMIDCHIIKLGGEV